MTMTLALGWWCPGVFLVVIGLGFIATSPPDRHAGFLPLPSGESILGILLTVAGVLWLVFGGLARLFP